MLERGKCNGRTHPEVERIVSDRRLFALVEGEDFYKEAGGRGDSFCKEAAIGNAARERYLIESIFFSERLCRHPYLF